MNYKEMIEWCDMHLASSDELYDTYCMDEEQQKEFEEKVNTGYESSY